MGRLEGRVAVITGAASGMGEATARLFAAEGAHVVLADLNVPGGERVAQSASQAGPRCIFQRTDVSSEDEVAALIARAVGEFGRLDITFNNAGIGGAVGPLERIRVEDWDRTFAVCLRGVFLGIKHSIAPMRAGGGGAIISTSSISGMGGWPDLHAYAAAKAGVINLTRSAAVALGADNIRVNCIAPGGVSTPIVYGGLGGGKEAAEALLAQAQPIKRAGQPEDIAEAALFLASDAARFISGHTLVVDGGAVAPAAPMAAAPRPLEFWDQQQRSFAGPSFEV